MPSLKLSLNKRKVFFCYLGFAFCQIFANLKKKKKNLGEQENTVVLQLGYPRYQNNPLCKTVVWCRIQSYFKDLPKENCAKWEKSPSCFILQNKPNWKCFKDLVGWGEPCNHCSSNTIFSVIFPLLHSSNMDPCQCAQMIRNFSDVPCVLLSALERWNRPSLIHPLTTETRPGWCGGIRLHIEIEHRDLLATGASNNRQQSGC